MRGMNWKLGAAIVVLGGAVTGCGGPLKYEIHGTPKAPEIDVHIVADVNKDSAFTSFKINVEHLAPPGRLGDGKKFVVWAKGAKSQWYRVGALKYDDDSRKASIDGVSTPVTAFDMEITVEHEVTPEAPSSDVVFSQHVN